MKAAFFTTKRYTYIVINNVKTLRTRKIFIPKVNHKPFEEVENQDFSYYPPFSVEIEGAPTDDKIEEAYVQFCHFCKKEYLERKEENDRMKEQEEESTREFEKELAENKVFEANPENIQKILKYLNSMNWGVWKLPEMSIGYKAHQYDCEGGKIATTITLDEPIDFYGRKESKFKIGGGRRDLTKYNFIR